MYSYKAVVGWIILSIDKITNIVIQWLETRLARAHKHDANSFHRDFSFGRTYFQ